MAPVESRLHVEAELRGGIPDGHPHALGVGEEPVGGVQASQGRARESVEGFGASLALEALPAALAARASQLLATAVRAFLDGLRHLGLDDLRLDLLLAFGECFPDSGDFCRRQLGYRRGQLADIGGGFQGLGLLFLLPYTINAPWHKGFTALYYYFRT